MMRTRSYNLWATLHRGREDGARASTRSIEGASTSTQYILSSTMWALPRGGIPAASVVEPRARLLSLTHSPLASRYSLMILSAIQVGCPHMDKQRYRKASMLGSLPWCSLPRPRPTRACVQWSPPLMGSTHGLSCSPQPRP